MTRTHLGTFRGVNNRPRARHREPIHNLAHTLISGVVMAAFVVAMTVWLGGL